MIYNITTGTSSGNLDPVTPNKVQLPLKSTDYNFRFPDLSESTGGPINRVEIVRFPTVARNGTQPSINNGVYIIDETTYLIK
jgi:hypothetical protein